MAIRILCLHGVHTQEQGPWLADWQQAIVGALGQTHAQAVEIECHAFDYNHHFEAVATNLPLYLRAVKRLWSSYWTYRQARGLGHAKGLGSLLDTTVGMVAKWVAVNALRTQLRQALQTRIEACDPHVICAHSMGSLIAYDLLCRDATVGRDRLFISLGSQIGHPAVREVFGYLQPLGTVRHWYHLFNEEDALFTAELDFPDHTDRFTQLNTPFDIAGLLDHDAVRYLSHPGTVQQVWLGLQAPPALARSRSRRMPVSTATELRRPWFKPLAPVGRLRRARKALLIGINDYPQPEHCLQGCVNDVFLISALLQERGYAPQDILVVLNERATTARITDRLDWLLKGVQAGDERVLYYSGHGAQVVLGTEEGESDHKVETLVSHDFDWKDNLGITDDLLAQYYSQLPYGARLSLILDCCHAGGMTRASGGSVRGLNPPDDIRHKSLQWDRELQMWLPRQTLDLRERLRVQSPEEVARFLGRDGATQKMGRAVSLWADAPPAPRKTRAATQSPSAPYNPVVLAACDEDQFAYEYTHGSVPFGAMTFMLAQQMRSRTRGKTLEDIQSHCNRVLIDKLGYAQTVQLYRPRGHSQTHFPGHQKEN